MDIKGNLAILCRSEQETFGISEDLVLIARLPCSETLNELCDRQKALQDAEAALPVDAYAVTYGCMNVVNKYSESLSRVKTQIKRATNIGARVLIYETEIVLGINQ